MSLQLQLLVTANRRVGMGHLVRCQLLAQEARDQGLDPSFQLLDTPADLAEGLRAKGERVEAWSGRLPGTPGILLSDLGAEPPPPCSSLLAQGWQQAVITNQAVAIDTARWMINPNPMAPTLDYDAPERLLGPAFLPIKREVRTQRPNDLGPLAEAQRVLVTFGGSDPTGLTRRVVESLCVVDRRLGKLVVVLGPLFPEPEVFASWASSALGTALELHVATDEMPRLLAGCDFAITSTGLTWFELACLGKPSLVVGGSEHERRTAKFLSQQGYAVHLGDGPEAADEVGRTLLSLAQERSRYADCRDKAFRLVDGQGAFRIIQALRGTAP